MFKYRTLFPQKGKMSFSQTGEDLLVDFLIKILKIPKFTYLDIGAHHPVFLNNTYLFYTQGFRGVCVEPDPVLFEIFKKNRKGDQVLNFGVGSASQKEADFYLLSTASLNTFSKKDADRYVSHGKQKIEKILKIPFIGINDLIKEYFQACPTFISLDVEGLDFDILRSFDFQKHRPTIFCLETLTYTEDHSERKLVEIIEYMHKNNYMTWADTYINTIFVDTEKWNKRG